jgi:hypothetical protein
MKPCLRNYRIGGKMTYDDDFIQVQFEGGIKRYKCTDFGIEWPPPDIIQVYGFEFKLERCSQITDEQRAEMTHVCRGAEYISASIELVNISGLTPGEDNAVL